jgi:hypothetical protein
MNTFGALIERLFERRERGRGLQVTGNAARSRSRIVSLSPTTSATASPRKRARLREHRLVRERRNHAIAIRAGDILGGEDGDDSECMR